MPRILEAEPRLCTHTDSNDGRSWQPEGGVSAGRQPWPVEAASGRILVTRTAVLIPLTCQETVTGGPPSAGFLPQRAVLQLATAQGGEPTNSTPRYFLPSSRTAGCGRAVHVGQPEAPQKHGSGTPPRDILTQNFLHDMPFANVSVLTLNIS